MSGITLKLSEMAPQTWAEVHFSELNLDHEKRNQRAITLATAFATQP